MRNHRCLKAARAICVIAAFVCLSSVGFAADKPAKIPQTPPQAARQGVFVFPRGETGKRGGAGFAQRVLRAAHDFENHISLDPPHRPVSP